MRWIVGGKAIEGPSGIQNFSKKFSLSAKYLEAAACYFLANGLGKIQVVVFSMN